MIGDVNLFIDWSENSAEVEIMLAEPSARGKGWAHEAVSLMLSYALNVGLRVFFLNRLQRSDNKRPPIK